MPTHVDVLKRYQNQHLLNPIIDACKKITIENRYEIQSEIIELLKKLPSYYKDVKTTMKQRSESLSYSNPTRGQAEFLGTLATFVKDFDRDFMNLPAQPAANNAQPEQKGLSEIIAELGLQVAEVETIPAREAAFESLPQGLHQDVKRMLNAEYPSGIYKHQAAGIQAYLEEHDVCLATSTASGKSMVFQTAAADLLLRDPDALVIAMYPARALVQDQLSKWRRLGQKLGVTVGQIDGSVSLNQRYKILNDSNIVVMTPDVVHAWLMRELKETSDRLKKLKLLILDEAHVYTGVFGTNMAYLMRRIHAVSSQHRIICATATIGEPEKFLEKLTGKNSFKLVGDELNGAPSGGKKIQLINLKANSHKRLILQLTLLKAIAINYPGNFLAFTDSRILVQKIGAELMPFGVMPYMSGYEEKCSKEIQKSLNTGKLKGVVSTSALEIGLDIANIDLVVILSYPPSINAFRQRIGRAGRANQLGECLIVDTQGLISGSDGGLATYLAKPAENAHLYLGNQALEFGSAMCAYDELSQLGLAENVIEENWVHSRFPNLPATFHGFLANEKEPYLTLSPELEKIRQEITLGGARPQLHITLRGVGGTDFKLCVRNGQNAADYENSNLGDLTAAQRFREAYPGAIHLLLGSRYRVMTTRRGPNGREIILRPLGNFRAETQIEPSKFIRPIYSEKRLLKISDDGFVTAAMVQIQERIDGFSENGHFKAYDANSPYFQRSFGYVRDTCGVIWHLGEDCMEKKILPILAEALTTIAEISGREIGFGTITQQVCPIYKNCGTTFVIYDDTPGNFFLTDALIRYWPEILERAKFIAVASEMPDVERIIDILDKLQSRFLRLQDGVIENADVLAPDTFVTDESEWFLVIANGEKVLNRNDPNFVELVVTNSIMTRDGLKYVVEGVQGAFDHKIIFPVALEPQMEWFNIIERRPYEVGPDYFVLQDLRNYTPNDAFEFRHVNHYTMEPTTELKPGKIQIVRDPRIPGGIAFGMIEEIDGGWFRVSRDNEVVASFQANPEMGSIEWLAMVVEVLTEV
jgi:DEAD/DEAH box helicase domain-containing protein